MRRLLVYDDGAKSKIAVSATCGYLHNQTAPNLKAKTKKQAIHKNPNEIHQFTKKLKSKNLKTQLNSTLKGSVKLFG